MTAYETVNNTASITADPKTGVSRPRRHAKSGVNRSPADAAAIEMAKSRFVKAVNRGIKELTSEHGYSREHATETLLREIRRDDSPPSDEEVFHVMNSLGMGMEDASRTVTVARALRRVRSEQGLTSVDAIDELTKRLSLSAGFANAGSALVSPEDGAPEVKKAPIGAAFDSEENVRTKSLKQPPCLLEPSRPSQCLKAPQKTSKVKKQLSRKRPLSDPEDVSCSVDPSVQPQLASNDEVESEIAKKKAKFSDDARSSISADNSLKCRSPPPTRTIRASAADDNVQQLDPPSLA